MTFVGSWLPSYDLVSLYKWLVYMPNIFGLVPQSVLQEDDSVPNRDAWYSLRLGEGLVAP